MTKYSKPDIYHTLTKHKAFRDVLVEYRKSSTERREEMLKESKQLISELPPANDISQEKFIEACVKMAMAAQLINYAEILRK